MEKLENYLNQVIEPYKRFKKMIVGDSTTRKEFTG